jgi:hypothetical protein
MATPLESVVAALSPTGYATVGRVPGQINAPTLLVGIDRIEPGGVGRIRRWTIAVTVLSALQDPEAADMDLEAAVTKVLDAIDKAQPMRWTQVEYGALNEQYIGLKVSIEILTQEGTP